MSDKGCHKEPLLMLGQFFFFALSLGYNVYFPSYALWSKYLFIQSIVCSNIRFQLPALCWILFPIMWSFSRILGVFGNLLVINPLSQQSSLFCPWQSGPEDLSIFLFLFENQVDISLHHSISFSMGITSTCMRKHEIISWIVLYSLRHSIILLPTTLQSSDKSSQG